MDKEYVEHLLKSKGFELNTYPDSVCWKFVTTDDEEMKDKICKIFGANIELYVGGTDIDTLILQCRDDFSK